MRPKKRRTGPEQPDAVKDEVVETIGGTDNEATGEDERWEREATTEEDVGYGRPLEQGGEDDIA